MAFAKRQEAPAMIAHFYFDIFFSIFPGFSDPYHSYGISCCAYNSPSLNTLVYYSWPKHEHVRTDIFTHVQHVLNHQPYTPSPSLNSLPVDISTVILNICSNGWFIVKFKLTCLSKRDVVNQVQIFVFVNKMPQPAADTSFFRHTHVVSSASECD